MVAVITGNGLGLVAGSGSVLGAGGQLGNGGVGRGGDLAYVNAKTGNLVVQSQDELLVGRGPDIGVVRTYNSNATFDFDNNDGWQVSLYRKLGNLTGTVNTAGSTLKRYGADGTQTTYTYDAILGKYTNKDGGGAYDTLTYVSATNTWTWTDGSSQIAETYAASPTAGEWRITAQKDLDGNTLTYTYDATTGLISQIADANGETTKLVYDTATKRLMSIQVVTGAATTTRISYTYDGNGRLWVVSTDLTPANGTDAKTYTTTYTYDLASTRIASITNSDGTKVSFTYDASFRVQTVVDGIGKTTTFTYNTGNTTVTDPLGQISTLTYDANGNLTRLQGPAGSGQDVNYTYDADGDLSQLKDSRGNTVAYTYDISGNLIRQQDAAGNVVERSYDGANQLVRETAYAVPDPDGAGSLQATVPQTTYYIRDAEQHLRFIVSPEGRVTEYRYDSYGQQTASLTYTAASFNPATLATWAQDFSVGTAGISPATLPAGFAQVGGALQVTSTNQATAAYPGVYGAELALGTTWRAEVTTPATLTQSMVYVGIASGTWAAANYRRLQAYFGTGIAATAYEGAAYTGRGLGTAKASTTYVVEVVTETDGLATLYVYEKGQARASGYIDQRQFIVGQTAALSMQTYCGPVAAAGTLGSTNTILIDNLSTQLLPREADLMTWATAQDKTKTERTDYVYDARGLMNTATRYASTDATTGAGVASTGSTTRYVYDSAGRLLQKIDPRGVATATNDNDYLTAYAYDGLGRTTTVTQYDAAGSAARTTQTVFNDASNRIELTLANGLKRVSTFDLRGLMVSQIEQDGATVLSTQTYQYDADGQLRVMTDPNGNKTYTLYDVGGRKIGEIDSVGALTEYLYNNAGQVTKTVRYATAVSANLATLFAADAGGVIANVAIGSVRPTTTALDQVTRLIYDAASRLRFTVDARGYVTENRYDGAGRLLTAVAYANAANNIVGLDSLGREAIPTDILFLTVAPTGTQIGLLTDAANDRITRNLYDNDGLLRGTLDGEGYLTEFKYDSARQLTQTLRYATVTTAADRAAGTLATLITSANAVPANNIPSYAWYNGFGQLTGSLDGEGYYAAYQYDLAGNRTKTFRYANRLVGTAVAETPPQILASVPGTAPTGGYVLTNAQDQTAQAAWTAFNQLDNETAVDSTITKYAYDLVGNRLSTIVAPGATDTRTLQARYDKQGRLTQELSALGSIALTALGASPPQAQIDAVWSAYGSTYTYDAGGRPTKRTDANGNVTLYFYDADNRLTYSVRRVRNPTNAAEWQGEVSARQYNALGQLTTEIGYANRILATPFATLTGGAEAQVKAVGVIVADAANDSRTDYTYHLTGELGRSTVKLNASQNAVTDRSYNAFGQLSALQIALDATHTRREEFLYERRGLLLTDRRDVVWASNVSATSVQTSSTYDAFGRAVTSTDGNGIVNTATYDKLGRQIQTVTGGSLNLTRNATYDAFGRVLTQTDALRNVTATAYAIDTTTGKTTITVTSPELIVTKVVTDRYGQTLTIVDGLLNETRYAYDANGNLLTTKRWDKAANAETTLETDIYDTAGLLLIKTQDANGNAVAYSYDAANRLLTRIVDQGGLNLTTTYAYDAKGQAVQVTDPNGVVTRTNYDLGGRVVLVAVDPTGLNLRTQYTYDLAGNRLTVVEGYGSTTARTTQYSYDSLNRRTQTVVDPADLKLTTTYAYDKNDNLVTKVAAAGTPIAQTTRYAYNQANRLVYAVDALGGVVKNDYDAEGHLIQSTAYAKAISLTGLATNPTVTAIAGLITAGTSPDRISRFAYDKNGRQRFVIDALGAVTETQYDADGNVLKTLQYANALTGTYTTGSLPTVGASGTNIITNSTADRISTYAYDAFNRLLSRTEAYGTTIARTESWVYDKAGNTVRHTDGRSNKEWFAFDAANRLIRHIDQGGYVTDTAWYADGSKQSEKRYMNAVALSTTDDLWAFAGHASNPVANTDAVSGDRTTSYTYDKAGRTQARTDALNVVTRYAYDALGNVTDTTVADGTAAATVLHRTYDLVGRVSSETRAYGKLEASKTSYGYDALGDQTSIIVADGTAAARTTTQSFDLVGRKTAVIDGNNATTTTTYNAFGDIVKIVDANNNAGYFYTDALGRVSLQVDPEGAVTETRYDLLGNTTETLKYANKVVGTVTEATKPQIGGSTGVYVVTSATTDQHQQAFCDVLGRKSEIRTWWGPNATDYYSETFGYDANDNVLTAKARNGAVTTYEYDKLDNKSREVLPVTSKNASNVDTPVENRYAYDALGNLITRTEAWGLPEQRITSYTYDKLNRQVKETGQAINTFNPVSQTDVVVTPVKQSIYDARGNVIEEVDGRGGRTLHTYDAQDRETGRIDASGAYVAWTYDAAGNRTVETRYANTVQIVGGGAIPNGTAPSVVTVAPTITGTAYVISDAANDRSVSYTYDGVGHQTGTAIAGMTVGVYDPNTGSGTYNVSTASITTSTVYDALGNVVKSIDGNGNVTRTYYNKAGQKVGQLDAKRYLTVWARDAYGNVLQQTQYANAVAGTLTVDDTTTLATLIANVTASGDDRITVDAYDKLNRVLTETRKSVASGTVNSGNGALTEATSDATTSYVYDGLNNVTRKTDALAAVTDWTYDGLGRKTKEQKPGYADYLGTSVRPTTDTEYDGLNHVKRELLRGTDNAVETDDRITVYTYGTGGFLASQTDAAGAVTQFRVDANGNITKKTLIGRGNADGTTPVNDATLYQYDALNRQVKSTDVTTSTTQELRYDAFGEITGKRTNGGGGQVAWQEFAQYDRAGRAWMSNAGDGVTKVYLFDANGNATLTVQSSGTDLTGQTMAAVIARNDTLKTISVFDARNQLTDTFEPTMDAVHQLVAVQANSTGQAVFVSNNSAIAIGAQSSVGGTAPATTNPVTAGAVTVGGTTVSGSARGSATMATLSALYPNTITQGYYYDNYIQSVSVTVNVPAALPDAGNIRAELTVSRAMYIAISENAGTEYPTWTYAYSYPPSVMYTTRAIFPSTYSGSSTVAKGSSQITVTAQPLSGSTPAGGEYIAGEQTYTVRLYQQTACGDILLGTQNGTVKSNWSSVGLSLPTPKIVYFNGQPPTATKLWMAYRPAGSTGPYIWLSVPQMYDAGGSPMGGWFSLDWAAAGFSGGNYEFQYFALDSSGAVVNQQSGTLNLTNPASPQVNQGSDNLGGVGGAGRGLVDNAGKLNLIEMGYVYSPLVARKLDRWATSLDVKCRVSGGNASPSSVAATLDSRGAGWFTVPTSTFTPGTNYDLDITANDANGVIQHCIAHVTWNGANPTISALTAVTAQPAMVHLTERADTAYVDVSYRVNNSGSAYSTPVRLTPIGTGLFDWDATALVADINSNYNYDVIIKAYSAGGLLNNQTNAILRLGASAAVVSAATQTTPLVLRLTPPQTGAASIKLGYRLQGSTGDYTTLAATLVSGEFRADLSALALPTSGSLIYEYVYDTYNGTGGLLGRNTGNFTLQPASTSSARLDWVIQNVSNVSNRVHKIQSTNAFGEVVKETDGLGRITDLTYNTLGQLVKKQDPLTNVTLANGFKQTARPTTRYVYDLAGRLVATVDANGNTNTQVWLAGATQNEIVLERHADSGTVTHGYDVFDDKRYDINEVAVRTDYLYDKMRRLIQVKHPQRAAGTPGNTGATVIQAIDAYAYDAAGNRISHTDALNDVEKTYYDSLGRVTQTRSYLGFATSYSYVYSNAILGVAGLQAGGWQKTTTDAVGRTEIDKQDSFGHTTWHQDLGGRQFTYSYNAAGWLTSQTGSNGQNIATDYYANGYIKSVWDKATGAYTSYEYDAAGNRIFEGYITLKNPADLNGGARDYYQYSILKYDELNRLVEVLDPKADIQYEFDANGNRRHVVSVYHDGLNGAMRTQDYWYAYDQMNRFTVTMGSLSTGVRGTSASDASVSIVKGTSGVAISYDLAGERKQADNADGTSETYSYSADGYLEDVKIGGMLRSRRNEDLAGRVLTYSEWNASGSPTYSRVTGYDKDSRVLTQSGTDGSTTNYYYTDASDNAATATTGMTAGAGQMARSTNVNGGTTVNSYYAYDYWDDAKEKAVTAQAYNPALEGNNAYWKPGYAKHVYDVNGHLLQAIDAGSDGAVGTGDDRTFRYTTDAQGLIMVRDEIAGGVANRVQRYYYANGVRVGDVGNDGPSRTDYVQAIAARGVDHKSYTNWKPVASADFDQNYEPVSPTYPGMTPSSYTVRTGDTLQSIARAVWGDSSLWYLIADANGLAGTETLKAGQLLTLPNKVTNIHNNAGTFRPYSAGEAIGDTSPTIPTAPPPPVHNSDDGGCGGIGSIIMIVVAVVVTIYTAGLAAEAMGVVVEGAGGLAAAAIGGAVGSVAGQLTGMALGVQNKFSWGAVAAGALGSMATAAIGPIGSAVTSSPIGAAMITAAADSVATQGANILTGQQHGFSWSNVAAAAISAPIAQSISNNLLSANGALASLSSSIFGSALVRGSVSALVSATTHVAIQGGHLQWASIAADALSGTVQGMYGNGGGSGGSDSLQISSADPLGQSWLRYPTGDEVNDPGLALTYTGANGTNASPSITITASQGGSGESVCFDRGNGCTSVTPNGASSSGAFDAEGSPISIENYGSYSGAMFDRQGNPIGGGTRDIVVCVGGEPTTPSPTGYGPTVYERLWTGGWDVAFPGTSGLLDEVLGVPAGVGSMVAEPLVALGSGLKDAALSQINMFGTFNNLPAVQAAEQRQQERRNGIVSGATWAANNAKLNVVDPFGQVGRAYNAGTGAVTGMFDDYANQYRSGDTYGATKNLTTKIGNATLLVGSAGSTLSSLGKLGTVANSETISVFRKMSSAEADMTFETRRLQPQIKLPDGKTSDSSKYLSESFEKVQQFQNKGVAVGTDEHIVEFVLDRQGYNDLMTSAVKQSQSKGVDAIKFHYEGMSTTSNPALRNIGVPASKLDEFNQLIINIKRVNGG